MPGRVLRHGTRRSDRNGCTLHPPATYFTDSSSRCFKELGERFGNEAVKKNQELTQAEACATFQDRG